MTIPRRSAQSWSCWSGGMQLWSAISAWQWLPNSVSGSHLFVCLFVCWNKTRKAILHLLCWEGVKPLELITHLQSLPEAQSRKSSYSWFMQTFVGQKKNWLKIRTTKNYSTYLAPFSTRNRKCALAAEEFGELNQTWTFDHKRTSVLRPSFWGPYNLSQNHGKWR